MTGQTGRYFVGLGTGSGGDGVDAVLAAVTDTGPAMRVRQVRHGFVPYGESLCRRVLSAMQGQGLSGEELARLDRDVGRVLADAAKSVCRASRVARRKLIAVGCERQTLARVGAVAPEGAESPGVGAVLQVGSSAIVAEQTGLPVVSDFSQSDLAAGGRGAPLTAWPDYVLFHHGRKARVLVNLGAVATMTFLPADGLPADTLAFDTGPGTGVIDALVRHHFDRPYDADGAIAAGSKAAPAFVAELLADPYFLRPPPKTCLPRQWGRDYVGRLEAMAHKRRMAPADLVACASEVTVQSLIRCIGALTQNPHEVILCGGGAKNIYLAMRLRKLLLPAGTVSIERFDIDAPAKAGLTVAMLAAARLDDVPANIPAVTGAARAVLLGSITEV